MRTESSGELPDPEIRRDPGIRERYSLDSTGLYKGAAGDGFEDDDPDVA